MIVVGADSVVIVTPPDTTGGGTTGGDPTGGTGGGTTGGGTTGGGTGDTGSIPVGGTTGTTGSSGAGAPGTGDTTGVIVRPPDIPDVKTSHLAWRWTSWAGDTWNLTDRTSPVLKLAGATGLGPATPEHWWTDAPAIAGSSWEGYHTARGSVFLPLLVRGADTDDFLAQHSRFLRSLNPNHEGTLTVIRPDGEERTIACRYESGADLTMTLDPLKVARASYGITWATADPYWSGETISTTYGSSAPTPLFPGPPFAINSAKTIGAATFTNPGDVPSAPVWRVNGPVTAFTVGLGTSVVSMTFALPAGQWIEIDMHSTKRTMLHSSGVDVWLYATQAEFADIPPGSNVPLNISVSGSTAETNVVLTFTPKYSSAWM